MCMGNGSNHSTAVTPETAARVRPETLWRESDLAFPRIFSCWRNRALSCLLPSSFLRETFALKEGREKLWFLLPEPVAPDFFTWRHGVYRCWQWTKLICLATFPLSLHFNYVVRANSWLTHSSCWLLRPSGRASIEVENVYNFPAW